MRVRETVALLLTCFLAAVLLGACSTVDPAEEAPPATRPNLLLFIVDDMRFDAAGFAGHPVFQSPQMDRLAAEGAVFDDAFVITSLCSPSRATMLTGRYTHEHGVTDIWTDLDPGETTFAGLLRDSGYETAWIGKWHLDRAGAPHPDFDHWISFPVHGRYLDPLLNVDGQVEVAQGHMTDVITDRALAFLELPRDRPFFLAVSHPAVHQPWIPQARFDGLYAGAGIELPATWDDGNPGKPSYLGCRATAETDEQMRDLVRDYLDLLAGVDESLGLLLDGLQAQGILDDTMVMLIGDNGYLLGEHGMLDKRTAYEPSMRIPLVVRYPRWFGAGTRVADNLALNLDVPVTLLDAAGVPVPTTMRGSSLRALAEGSVVRDEFLYQYFRDPQSEITPEIRALRTLDLKYIRHPDSFEPEELYDLRNDQDETLNLAGDAAWSDELGQMRQRLDELQADLGDSGPPSAAARYQPDWVARAFVRVLDAKTLEPIPRATVRTEGWLAPYAASQRTGPDGRWYACATTSATSVQFRVLEVSSPGYITAGPFAPVTLEPSTNHHSQVVKIVASPLRH